MTAAVAIVGMACRYPDARSPQELWENVLARRRAFRRLPHERLRLEDYFSASRNAPDRTYAVEAAVIDGFEFDRVQFRVSGEAFRAADTAHWLALDVASQALDDAGYLGGRELPLGSTGVLIGNTLTGEFSRANSLRLRWPYVRRVLEAALTAEQYPPERQGRLLDRVEDGYKQPFPETGDESLAGGLSNTIAGRICNHFHLKGGGFTIDGACAASLLAVASACSALTAGDLDVAVAGGVDLSLDPFELVGFAKAGALANSEMRVYDRCPTGFLPGEGCGFVVLMRADDALAAGRRIYAVIRGWGISSDGAGGITRPEVDGQALALLRAYRRAGIDPAEVPYFEGHGTGTGVGDSTELEALARARGRGASSPAATLGSIKANIGHTKAAAGVAGLIKAVSALHHQVLPPTTGCVDPHPVIADAQSGLRVADDGECWPRERPLYAGVSAMGFGGINTHLVLEGIASNRRRELSAQNRTPLRSPQDAELLCLSATSRQEMLARIESLIHCSSWLSHAQLPDLAAHLAGRPDSAPVRLAVVASSPAELADRLETARSWVSGGETDRLDVQSGMFLGIRRQAPRVGFVFPGQAAPVYRHGQAWSRRFDQVRELYDRGGLNEADMAAAVQPAIVTASLAGLHILARLGVNAELGVGHSLGELVALHWAGAMDEWTLLRIAAVRGCAMARAATGTMAAIKAGETDVLRLVNGSPAVIACLNSPRQTVIAGERGAVEAVAARAQASGVEAVMLPVLGAFHSPLVAGAVPPLAEYLSRETMQLLTRQVFSGVTGLALPPTTDLKELLCRQVTSPVRLMEAVAAAGVVDLWIEVGPGATLAGPFAEMGGGPLVSLDASGQSLGGLLRAAGASFALGARIDLPALFSDRLTRPVDPDTRPAECTTFPPRCGSCDL
jgi:enediyne polyketide synthase